MINRLLKLGFIAMIFILLIVIGLQLWQLGVLHKQQEKSIDYALVLDQIDEALKSNEDQDFIDSLVISAQSLLYPELQIENQNQIRLLFLEGVNYMNLLNLEKAMKSLVSAEALIEHADNELEFDIIYLLGYVSWRLGKEELVEKFFPKYIEQKYEEKQLFHKSNILLNYGRYFLENGNVDEGMRLFHESYSVALEANDANMIVRSQSFLIKENDSLTAQEKVLKLKALEAYVPRLDVIDKRQLFVRIGNIYDLKLRNYEEACKYELKELETYYLGRRDYFEKRRYGLCITELAARTYNIGKIEEAKQWIERAEEYISLFEQPWLSFYHRVYIAIHKSSKVESQARFEMLNQLIEQRNFAAMHSIERLEESKRKIEDEYIESQSQLEISKISKQRWMWVVLSLVLLSVCLSGLWILRRNRRRGILTNSIKNLQSLFIYGTLQDSPIESHIYNAVFEVKEDYPRVADKLVNLNRELQYSAGDWKDPMVPLKTEIAASRIMLDIIDQDEEYEDIDISMVVADDVPIEELMVPRYFVKACVFLMLTVIADNDLKAIQLRVSYDLKDLRVAVVLDHNPNTDVLENPCANAINEVLRYYKRTQISIKPIIDHFMIDIPVPVQA